ncbi:MAG: hypothetical protein HAW60_04250 [Bdellovibrionales bacterium]|nr:hypothetical protein [Bdellovibrionales bacterium]
MNNKIAEHIIKNLLLQNITDFCICAGGRNVPLISVLQNLKENLKENSKKENSKKGVQLNFYEFFDERSASFFALGRSKSTKKPTAVITTSGTAVAETLPAMLEAKYSNTELIILSADRPKSYRNSYAPQTMNQNEIFKFLNINLYDLDKQNFQEFNLNTSTKKQTHINACFEDPIVFDKKTGLDSKILARFTEVSGDSARRDVEPATSVNRANILESKHELNNQALPVEDSLYLSKFFSNCTKPLVLVSKLDLKNNLDLINFLLKFNSFVYLETGSKLWGDRKLELLLLKAGEKTLEKAFADGLFDSVIKIGGTPTIGFWRLLENKFSNVSVLSVVEHGGSGLSRITNTLNVKSFLNSFANGSLSSSGVVGDWGRDSDWKKEVRELDKKFYDEKNIRIIKNSFSEEAVIKKMSEVFDEKDNIFLGNSLSIRNWDAASVKKQFVSIESHRGLNGIDGLVSGFFGWASGLDDKNKSWAVIGDLSTMYDLNSLWITKQLQNKNWAIVVINNSGGKIFKPMFNQEILEARHNLNFQAWAKMFNCQYTKIEAKDFSSQFNKDLKGIVEVCF